MIGVKKNYIRVSSGYSHAVQSRLIGYIVAMNISPNPQCDKRTKPGW